MDNNNMLSRKRNQNRDHSEPRNYINQYERKPNKYEYRDNHYLKAKPRNSRERRYDRTKDEYSYDEPAYRNYERGGSRKAKDLLFNDNRRRSFSHSRDEGKRKEYEYRRSRSRSRSYQSLARHASLRRSKSKSSRRDQSPSNKEKQYNYLIKLPKSYHRFIEEDNQKIRDEVKIFDFI